MLNIIFLALAAVLIARYFRKGGGIAMLRMMNTPMPAEHHHPDAGSHETEVPHAP